MRQRTYSAGSNSAVLDDPGTFHIDDVLVVTETAGRELRDLGIEVDHDKGTSLWTGSAKAPRWAVTLWAVAVFHGGRAVAERAQGDREFREALWAVYLLGGAHAARLFAEGEPT